MKTRGIQLKIDGVAYDHWLSAEVSRDLNDFSGSFSFTCRDYTRSTASFDYASLGPMYRLKPGGAAEISINGQVVMKGWIERVAPSIGEQEASVTISGRDKAGDLIDCAATVEGPAEYKNVKLEEAVKRIAKPYGLSVRNEIDTGEPFERYSIDLSETAFSAIEKGTRSRSCLVLSDGVGGIVLTRTGKQQAPAALTLPGNTLRAQGAFSHEGRHSETVVRGQKEASGKDRTAASLTAGDAPKDTGDRQDGDGSATENERKGTVATGRAKDDEITRYRPAVHLARSKADKTAAQDEADWRNRTARAKSEDITHTVKGFSVNGVLWQVNQMVPVSNAYLGIERDMLISRVSYIEDDAGAVTDLTIISPEAFDKGEVGNRRTNKQPKAKAGGAKSAGGGLDGTAQAL